MNHRDALMNSLGFGLGLMLVACGGGSRPAGTPASTQTAAPVAAFPTASPCTREIPVAPASPVALRQMKWSGGTGRAEGTDPQAIFVVPTAGPVCGIRLRFTLETRDRKPAFFQVFWARPGVAAFSEAEGSWGTSLESSAQEQTVVVPAQGQFDRIRIDPADKPAEFKLAEMTLLAPAS